MKSRYAMCPDCGHRMNRLYDKWGNWDGETYVCNFCPDEVYSEEEEEDDSERLSASDAPDIWASGGMDEDDTFGYTEDELWNAW